MDFDYHMTSFQPMGDQAVLAVCPDEAAAARLAAIVRRLAPVWLVDVVQAYTTVAIFFDLDQACYQSVQDRLHAAQASANESAIPLAGARHVIPCCYELQLDLSRVARAVGLSEAEVIQLHCATEYTVYAIGFCSGFPYLGYLPERLCGVPRLESPRLRVEPGSVGLTGRQTGIYTEARPGGWNLIGQTPLELVNVKDGYFPLRTGDIVRFEPIDKDVFHELRGKRLPDVTRT